MPPANLREVHNLPQVFQLNPHQYILVDQEKYQLFHIERAYQIFLGFPRLLRYWKKPKSIGINETAIPTIVNVHVRKFINLFLCCYNLF